AECTVLCSISVSFCNSTAPNEFYTLSLHDALPIYFCLFWLPGYLQEESGLTLAQIGMFGWIPFLVADIGAIGTVSSNIPICANRSEEHTSELQSRENLVCRLLLEKKKNKKYH